MFRKWLGCIGVGVSGKKDNEKLRDIVPESVVQFIMIINVVNFVYIKESGDCDEKIYKSYEKSFCQMET